MFLESGVGHIIFLIMFFKSYVGKKYGLLCFKFPVDEEIWQIMSSKSNMNEYLCLIVSSVSSVAEGCGLSCL